LASIKSNKDLFKKIFAKKDAQIIWEIKLKSPSISNLALDKNIATIINFYWNNPKIKAVSNLIDKKYFSWDINLWTIFKEKFKKPILFKEFVIDKTQIDWASYFWYDALLLIKRILKKSDLINLINYTQEKNIFPIVEIDNEKDLKEIIKLSNSLDFWIAINSRNLWNMQIDNNSHINFQEKYKDSLVNKLLFAFSWITNLQDIKKYKHKFNWVLIWTYFMKNI
jgi:indole-3-glycerol phosphate synthase